MITRALFFTVFVRTRPCVRQKAPDKRQQREEEMRTQERYIRTVTPRDRSKQSHSLYLLANQLHAAARTTSITQGPAVQATSTPMHNPPAPARSPHPTARPQARRRALGVGLRPLNPASRRQRGLCIIYCTSQQQARQPQHFAAPEAVTGQILVAKLTGPARSNARESSQRRKNQYCRQNQRRSVEYLPLPKNVTYHVGDEGASTQTVRCKR